MYFSWVIRTRLTIGKQTPLPENEVYHMQLSLKKKKKIEAPIKKDVLENCCGNFKWQ